MATFDRWVRALAAAILTMAVSVGVGAQTVQGTVKDRSGQVVSGATVYLVPAADVAKMKNDAEAKGAKLLVEAFGSPQAYNLYTFAKNFHPTDLRLIFAGPGTFWTDLKNFEPAAARKLLEGGQQPQGPQR